jgi:indolepyruvate ferredoxin oxidoreductase
MARASKAFSLDDRYRRTEGDILLSGVQAAVRAPLDQLRADRRNGRRTAAFVSGYPGSPLGGYDREIARQRALCAELGLVHRPGLNEELAATAVMGSQLATGLPGARHEGIVGVWYGKAPGFDRSADAIRHASWAGTSRLGGVLALVGDDHACKSSTLPSRSDATIAAVGLPVLTPGSPQEVLDLALHGFALSRLAGTWVAMKLTTPVADGTAVATVHPDRVVPVIPDLASGGKPWAPTLDPILAPPRSAALEHEVLVRRVEAVLAYTSANRLDHLEGAGGAWLTIVAAGHTFHETVEALRALGLGPDDLASLGVRLVRLGVVHPLDRGLIRRAAEGVLAVLVVEDKLPFVETAVRDALYRRANAPEVLGKLGSRGEPLIPVTGALTSAALVEPLRRVLTRRIPEERLARPRRARPLALAVEPHAVRAPSFCSGCPHNVSLQVPGEALVGAGIGCHLMAVLSEPDRVGRIVGITQMGGEGAQWLGIEPFVEEPHLFQNMGDGTFFHSGQLAVQAAVAAGSHVTFKLLYNGAVAMTGGQDAVAGLTVEAILHKLHAEGVRRIVVTTADPSRYRGVRLPEGAEVRDRAEIVLVQEELRRTPGVTVLVHDQRCAAELRRDRKRGRAEDPGFRVVIDPRVCEGCGDCGKKSACLSLVPLETEFGRKTAVDQTTCNVDAACLAGDCPAFVKVRPGRGARRKKAEDPPSDLPPPTFLRDGVTIRMPGIGGTGVVTVSQILATAARLDGKDVRAVDQTGLSQKAGPVVSILTIGDAAPGIDVLLAFDLLVAATPENLDGLDLRPAVVVASTTPTPTAKMIGRVATAKVDLDARRAELDARTDPARNRYVDAGAITTLRLGDALCANIFLTGVAHQLGLLPVSGASIERAIELNGQSVAENIAAFRWGRAWALDPARVEGAARARRAAVSPAIPRSARQALAALEGAPALHELARSRVVELMAYQGERLVLRYLRAVVAAHEAERSAGGDVGFARTVAFQLHRLMAYKDEYEVARLLLEGRRTLAGTYGEDARIEWQLHPPLLRALGMRGKISLGVWAVVLLVVLRALRRLRGTLLDPFGRAHVRRIERALIPEYEALVTEAAGRLRDDPAGAVRLVGLVDVVRGYEGVKLDNIERYRAQLAEARVGRVGGPGPCEE